MVVAEEEVGVQTVEVCLACQSHRVAEEWEIQVGGEVQLQLSGILACHPQLAHEVEV